MVKVHKYPKLYFCMHGTVHFFCVHLGTNGALRVSPWRPGRPTGTATASSARGILIYTILI
jgi:hypothetical protein